MKELSSDLYERCLNALADCREFESDKSLRSVFISQEIEPYSRYIDEKDSPDARIKECVRALRKRSYKGRSVLALFLQAIAERCPEGDGTRAELEELAREITISLELADPSPLLPAPLSDNAQSTTQTLEMQEQEVLVIWGKEDVARIEIFEFLRGAGLFPVEWSVAVGRTGKNAPAVDEVLQTAFDTMKAVVIVLTGDDIVISKVKDFEYEQKADLQPSSDTLFKAGVAFGIEPSRTVLLGLGRLRPFGNILDRYVISMTNQDNKRKEFMTRLKNSGCVPTKDAWHVKGNFNNRSFYRMSQIDVKVAVSIKDGL